MRLFQVWNTRASLDGHGADDEVEGLALEVNGKPED